MEKEYNELCNVSLINLYTLSKEKEEINLTNFDFKDKKHLYLLSIAKILNSLYNYPIYIQSNLFDYLKYKIKHRKENIKYKKKILNDFNIDDFLDYITTQRKIDKDIWIKIYDEFFKEN